MSTLVEGFKKAIAIWMALAMTSSAWAANGLPTNNQQVIAQYYIAPQNEPSIAPQTLLNLLRQNTKYVFVFYQENRSFDHYFGTYPGAEGIYTNPAAQTPGFTQSIQNIDGSVSTITPFRLDPGVQYMYPADTDDVNHSHAPIVAKMDFSAGKPKMDMYAIVEEQQHLTGGEITQKAVGYGQLTMAHVDCNTIPLLWQYASRFALFDHIFQYFTGPSTPGNIAIIAAQTGNTQWALHPNQAWTNLASGMGVPVMGDDDPFWGSKKDPNYPNTLVPSESPSATPQINLTFASLPLTLAGGKLSNIMTAANDPSLATDAADIHADIPFISNLNTPTVPWGWYEEGYDLEDTDTGGVASHNSYVTHHNGPQYFGYISNNQEMRSNLHGLGDFFTAISNAPGTANSLPGGVYWVKGGFTNTLGLTPVDPDVKVQANFLGDDDHPAYSDAQISEAMVATAINAIASSGYWQNSAIIITWDDSEGDWDHVLPPIVTKGPDDSVTTDGPRVPFLLLSPYAKVGYISKKYGTQVSAIRFINDLFNLPPLATLPNEELGKLLGQMEFKQSNLGPSDGPDSTITDLTDAFSPSRLLGTAPPLPASYVSIPANVINPLPQASGYGCSNLGITPTDTGLPNPVPAGFNPRPGTNPGYGIQPPVLPTKPAATQKGGKG
jgi:phospholipase C